MRKTVAILILTLVAALGAFVPVVAAAAPAEPKVVIIVGATHGSTAKYRTYADQAYVEARKYTSNVVKVYSPYATWTKVKAATVGANVVIYMGHGNGWPSPYTYDPKYTTKNGFGLNATSGAGDSNNKYYGEPYVSTLDLAPNAIVLLHHLCYAAGNSEPGQAEPSVSVARQRLDNYAAGFLKAGASAVIADGHAGPVSYLRSLFTTHQTIEQLWRTQPNANGHVAVFNSTRTPGATAFSDPNTTTSGFYRSMVGDRTITTDDILGEAYSDTSTDPATLLVPGNADVSAEGAGLYGDPATLTPTVAGEPDATLSAGTRLRVIGSAGAVATDGSAIVHVQGVDDESIDGYMAAGTLTARDSRAPVVRSLQTGGTFSPNGDDTMDTTTMTGRLSESAAWTLQVRDGSNDLLFSQSGSGSTFSATWDGTASGSVVPDGTYTVSVTAQDAWANGPTTSTASVVVDTVPSQLTAFSPAPDVLSWFAPNGDGWRDTISMSATNSEAGSFTVRVRNSDNTLVRLFTVPSGTGATAITWDGKGANGTVVPDGQYILRVYPVDAVGNAGTWTERPVNVVAALKSVASSAAMFFPQDLDGYSKTTNLSFVLARPMTVTWTIRNAAGEIVDTHLDAVELPAGTTSWLFDGRRTDGTMLPQGRYTSFVYATDGAVAASQSVAFEADAFTVKLNDTSPARGQTVTLYVTSAELLKSGSAPRAYVYEPGLSMWSVPLTKSGTYTYRATLVLKKGGTSGTLSIKVLGVDSKGQSQRTTRTWPIH